MTGGRTGLIGLTTPFLHDYWAAILAGVTEALYEQDMRFVLCPTHHEHDREVSLLERLMQGTTDGAILLLPQESSSELAVLKAHGFPFVVADPRTALDDGIPAVSATHWAGAKAATDRLLTLGHTRIAHVTGTRGWAATEERFDGYRAALAAAGVLPCAELIAESDFTADGGYAAASSLFDLDVRPTAIFASSDNMAVGALKAARERGLLVPDDLSIVGFDDIEVARSVSPQLTTIRQPLEEMGRMAASLLTRLLEKQRVEALRLELSTRLVVRESTAPPGT